MYIVWGSGGDAKQLAASQPSPTPCPNCQQQGTHSYWMIYRYFHIYYLFGMVTKRERRVVCDVCQNHWEIQQNDLPPELRHLNPVPFMKRCGLGVFGGIIVGLMFLGMGVAMFEGNMMRKPQAVAQRPAAPAQNPAPVAKSP